MIAKIKKKHNTLTLRDIYRDYEQNAQPGEKILSYKDWKRIMLKALYKVSLAIIRENLILKLDGSIGVIGVEKAKGNAIRRVDFNLTRQLGKTMFHANLHTDCYYFRFVWRRKRQNSYLNPFVRTYKFTAVQDQARREVGKRGLAAWVKHCSTNPYIKDYDAPFRIF